MNDLNKIEERLKILESKLDSIVELLSPNTNGTFSHSTDVLYDSFFDIQYQVKEADEERAKRNRLLIDFRNQAKPKYDNFLSAPKEEQEYLDRLVFNSVYAIYIVNNLMQLSDLYKANLYRLLSGEISREKFIASLKSFYNSRPSGFTMYGLDDISSKGTDFYKILEEKAKVSKLECIEYINN